jgi:ABC-type glycerol-3-phosphate transport system substrate-binding protein
MMGELLTNRKKGIWASEDGLLKGGFLNVYISWITTQAGGNPFDADETLGTSLEYIYDLIHKHHVLNPASLQKNYDQQNSDFIGNRVAFMRQWSFFYDVAQQNKKWFSDEKVQCALPPKGPGGKSKRTYAAGWGYGIPKTAKNLQAAKELIKFLIEKENVRKMVNYSTWFLNARHSVLSEAGQKGVAKFLKMYTDADAITTRPYHPKFMEALAVIENAVSAFLSDQIKLTQTMNLIKEQLQPI